MNNKKLNQLFTAAQKEIPAAPTDGFDLLVMQSIHREPTQRVENLFDQLNLLFPRLAFAAVAVIALCVAGDFASGAPSLTEGVAQITQQWLVF